MSDVPKLESIVTEIEQGEAFKYAITALRKGVKATPHLYDELCELFNLSLEAAKKLCENVYDKYTDEFNIDNRPESDRIRLFLSRKYEIRYNVVLGRTEYRLRNSTEDFEPINYSELYFDCNDHYHKIKKEDLKDLLKTKWVELYDPFAEYFSSLKYDPKRDAGAIEKLLSYITLVSEIPTPNGEIVDEVYRLEPPLCDAPMEITEREFFISMFKKHLVRSVACSLGFGENRFVFTLHSDAQEIGKSRFIRFLSPFDDKQYYSEEPISNDRDGQIALSENMIYNLEEIEDLTPRELSSMKAIISKHSINVRRFYAERNEILRRRCNFFASTNRSGILTDNQNSRWLIFSIGKIDYHGYSADIDIHSVWAEAYHLLQTGFDYQLTVQERYIREHRNKQEYEVITPEEDFLQKWFTPADRADKDAVFLSSTDFDKIIALKSDKTLMPNSYKMRAALKKLGFNKVRETYNNKTYRGFWCTIESAADYEELTNKITNKNGLYPGGAPEKPF